MTRRPIAGLTRDVLEPMARSGMYCRQIAREMSKILGRDVHEQRIRKRLVKWGIPLGYVKRPIDAEVREAIAALSDGNLTARELEPRVSARVGRSVKLQTIQRWQRRLNLARAPAHAIGARGVRRLGQPGGALLECGADGLDLVADALRARAVADAQVAA
jgi:hypothetical protein